MTDLEKKEQNFWTKMIWHLIYFGLKKVFESKILMDLEEVILSNQSSHLSPLNKKIAAIEYLKARAESLDQELPSHLINFLVEFVYSFLRQTGKI